MRLEFSILWFENQPADIATTLTEVREHIEEAGFQCDIDLQTDALNLEELSRRQERFNDFDLVLVDWDLGLPDIQGDEVAKRIRSRFGFTDIIFYSGKAPADLRGMVHRLGIDGVYCMPRIQLVGSLRDHIDEVVKRLSRLEAMRGIAVGTVGKCDEDFRALIESFYDASGDERQRDMRAELNALVEAGQANAARKFNECETFADCLESRAVTSFHLQKLALALTKGREDLGANRKTLCDYDREVLQPRNTLGHAIERRSDNGWEVLSGGQATITHDDFPSLRANFLRHLRNVAALRAALTERAE